MCLQWCLVKGTVGIAVGAGATQKARQADRYNKQSNFKIFVPLTECITETKNTRVDNASRCCNADV